MAQSFTRTRWEGKYPRQTAALQSSQMLGSRMDMEGCQWIINKGGFVRGVAADECSSEILFGGREPELRLFPREAKGEY